MESTLTQEEAGVAERLAMHIADNVDTEDFQTKNDSISCKLSFIMSLLENLIPEGHRVLIFSQTRKMLNLIQDSLTSNGYSFLRIDGTTKAPDRLKTVEEFQSGHVAPIFLLTSQVGGLGLERSGWLCERIPPLHSLRNTGTGGGTETSIPARASESLRRMSKTVKRAR